MKIEMGLFDHMVVQRNRRNVSEAVFAGTCAARGPVLATVRKGAKALKAFDGVKVGTAARRKFTGCLKGVPAGGPYTIELAVGGERLTVRDVLVGDVWLLGGQSNMQGCGLFPRQRLPVDPLVRAFTMDDRWGAARDPIHNMWACVDQVHIDLVGGTRPPKPPADWGVCPGPAFGNEMRRLTGAPQGLIACAHGGTSMKQWDPRRKREGGKSLYGAMVRRLNRNGRRVAGLVWYQGCSDALPGEAPLYTARMRHFVAAVRRDAGDPRLPVAMVQISRVIGWASGAAWNSIQDQQRRLPQVIRGLTVVPAIDLPLDDAIHISGAGQYVLGARLARAMQALRAGRRAGLPPPALKTVTLETARGMGVVVVDFEHVAGRLRSGDRPSGFAIVTQSGAHNHYDIQLDGPRARIRSSLPESELAGAVLHYGYGTDPYCNIGDAAGRPLPVFGPVRLGKARALSPFIRELRVSAFQPSAGRLENLDCPASLDGLGMTPRVFPETFCSLHPEIAQRGTADEVVYYACRFSCKEPMRLRVILGYDGPVKAWADGRQVFHDPNGINPARAEKGMAAFDADAGSHELVIALGTNHAKAWGIFLRLERLDVPQRRVERGPGHYEMPAILG